MRLCKYKLSIWDYVDKLSILVYVNINYVY